LFTLINSAEKKSNRELLWFFMHFKCNIQWTSQKKLHFLFTKQLLDHDYFKHTNYHANIRNFNHLYSTRSPFFPRSSFSMIKFTLKNSFSDWTKSFEIISLGRPSCVDVNTSSPSLSASLQNHSVTFLIFQTLNPLDIKIIQRFKIQWI